jgi:hypothetical protein
MNDPLHKRAEQLLAKERVEGISQAERAWLGAHLQGCERCAEFARETDLALRSLRTAAIPLPAGLASRTQDWPWSSVHNYTGSSARVPATPSGVSIDRVLLPADEHTRI